MTDDREVATAGYSPNLTNSKFAAFLVAPSRGYDLSRSITLQFFGIWSKFDSRRMSQRTSPFATAALNDSPFENSRIGVDCSR